MKTINPQNRPMHASTSHRRIRHRTRFLLICAMAAIWGYGLTAQAAPKTLTLEQAVTEGKALKNCPKRSLGVIEAVSAVDANAGSTTQPGGPVYLMFMSRDSVDAPVVGPLDRMPTPAQLEALKGQRMCVLS
jgi:hypothetical protein